ncbi:MAG: GNAT family N-acetyltransferase [Emcibacter sp.]|nr:GNAT family N-acetyltransferase [Emcibacter sp.]
MALPLAIETKKLILKPYEAEMLDFHVEILANWAVTQWLSTNVAFPYKREDGIKFIEDAIREFNEGISFRYAITDKATGRHVGGIRVFSETMETEVGYWLHPDFWGKGLGTEIVEAVVNGGFKGGIIKCFVAQTAAKNKGSRRILEKVGFKQKGSPPPEYSRCGHAQGCSEFYRFDIKDWKSHE